MLSTTRASSSVEDRIGMQLFKNLDKDTRRKLKKLFTNPTALLGCVLLAFYLLVAVK